MKIDPFQAVGVLLQTRAIMAADALAPCVARFSAAVMITTGSLSLFWVNFFRIYLHCRGRKDLNILSFLLQKKSVRKELMLLANMT